MGTKSPTIFAGIMLVIILMSGPNLAIAQCDGGPNCNCSAGHAVTGNQNGCRDKNCGCRQRSRRGRACQKCPKCQQDFCKLEVKKGKEKRTCFKTEQKIVCIPTFRLPWQKCQPTCSKTRVVNVLKKHKFECPKCEYKWSAYEPEVAQPEPKQKPKQTPMEASVAPSNQHAPNQYQYDAPATQYREPQYYDSLQQAEPIKPKYKLETFDPTGRDVPSPPKK